MTLAEQIQSPDIFRLATDLRRQRALSLGDALIATTAVHQNLTLATHNRKDVVVTTPEEITARGNLVGDVLRPALKEGITVYELR
ncbi:MAG: hypothetical protein WCK47_14125 [bacterium]